MTATAAEMTQQIIELNDDIMSLVTRVELAESELIRVRDTRGTGATPYGGQDRGGRLVDHKFFRPPKLDKVGHFRE